MGKSAVVGYKGEAVVDGDGRDQGIHERERFAFL
jgi:hypothetical protein